MVGPGFPIGWSSTPLGRGRRCLKLVLFGENACENERIGYRYRGAPPRSATECNSWASCRLSNIGYILHGSLLQMIFIEMGENSFLISWKDIMIKARCRQLCHLINMGYDNLSVQCPHCVHESFLFSGRILHAIKFCKGMEVG